jgi:glycosyltransferase involved in cell wall biosynthesis
MKILVLAPHPFFQHRGTPIAVRGLIEVLAGQGHELDVLTFHEGENIRVPNCTFHRIRELPGMNDLRPGFSVKKLICDALLGSTCFRLMRSKQFDLVHAVEEGAFVALAAKWRYKVPFVYDMDSSLPQQMMEKFGVLRAVKWPMEFSERLVIRRSAGVVAVCKALEEIARASDGDKLILRLEDPSLLSSNGERGDVLRETLPGTGPIVMYVGNLERYQGIDLLFAGFRHAHAQNPTLRLVVIGGSDADIAQYRQVAQQAGLGEAVHLIGPRPITQLAWYLRQADILVSPRSKGQNTPMKIYSYLDSGIPVLATDLPTHTQVLDRDIAFLVPPEPVAFGDGLVELARDAQLRAKIAANAKNRVKQEFSADAFRRKLVGFYRALEQTLARPPSQT